MRLDQADRIMLGDREVSRVYLGANLVWGNAFSPASLFAQGEPGVWYDPSDFSTLFQDAAGTTPVTAVEQPVGLMLDKSKGLVLGPELVTNGTFDTDLSGWNFGAGWSWDSGAAKATNTSSALWQKIGSPGPAKTFRIAFTQTILSGTRLRVRIRNFADRRDLNFWYRVGSQSVVVYVNSPDSGITFQVIPETPEVLTIDNISVRELPGNHAYQPTATSRPVLSARVNQYLATETLATQNVATLAAPYRLSFEGAGTITLSGTATGVYSAGSHLITCTAGTLTSTVSGSVTKADLRVANDGVNLPPYQHVNTATNYDTAGFPHYLRFDGVDDWLVTNTITPGTDKVQVFAGVRKLKLEYQAQAIVELGSNSFGTNGISVFSGGAVSNQTNEYSTMGFASAGYARDYAVAAIPSTDVLTALFDVANPVPTSSQMLRANGASASGTQVAGTNMGAGNFLQNPAYVGGRAGVRQFNGYIYSLIVRFGSNLPIETIEKTETWINSKTGAY